MTFEQRLINLVKEYELLYNPDHRSYCRTPLRTAAWVEIAEKMNSNRMDCKKKWKTLRDTYKKLLIKINANGGVYKYHRRKWQYLSLISFVNKYEALVPKEEDKEWPIFLDTCTDINTNIMPMMEDDASQSNHENGEKEAEAEYIDDVNLRSPQQYQQHSISSESYCSPVHDAENLKLIEQTHSYAKIIEPKDSTNDFSTEFVERAIVDILEPPVSSISACEEEEVFEEHLEETNSDTAADTPARSCSKYLAELGEQIDALCVPSYVQNELEKRIECLVHEVLEEYNTAEQFVEDS